MLCLVLLEKSQKSKHSKELGNLFDISNFFVMLGLLLCPKLHREMELSREGDQLSLRDHISPEGKA